MRRPQAKCLLRGDEPAAPELARRVSACARRLGLLRQGRFVYAERVVELRRRDYGTACWEEDGDLDGFVLWACTDEIDERARGSRCRARLRARVRACADAPLLHFPLLPPLEPRVLSLRNGLLDLRGETPRLEQYALNPPVTAFRSARFVDLDADPLWFKASARDGRPSLLRRLPPVLFARVFDFL